MPHEDQFTATGPAFTGAGFPRAAFSTGALGTDSTYGVNVQGSECGVYGEVLRTSTGRQAFKVDPGVCGVGDTYGVIGSGNIAGTYGVRTFDPDIPKENRPFGAGVLGSGLDNGNGVVGLNFAGEEQEQGLGQAFGVIGASNAGVGVLGLSVRKDFRSQADLTKLPDGEGTGVEGASGTGTGVHGRSFRGEGGQFESALGRGAVFSSGRKRDDGESNFRFGNVAQIRLEPLRQELDPLHSDPRLPKDGKVGDIILIRITGGGEGGNLVDKCSLWLCVPQLDLLADPLMPPENSSVWQQILLGGTRLGTE
jgi:hypothetical protein